jgi:hypothetical protein
MSESRAAPAAVLLYPIWTAPLLNADAEAEEADEELPDAALDPALAELELDTVTPKVEDEPAGRVVVAATLVEPDPEAVEEPDAEVDEALVLVWVLAPTLKLPVSANTSVMLPGLVALSVYPSRAGTVGTVRVRVWREGSTLLAMAKESWKASLTRKREKGSSVVVAVQVMVVTPSDVMP